MPDTAVGQTLLSLHGVSFSHRGIELLSGLDLAIGRGEIWAMVGANGAGKSLTLRLMHGLSQPTSGEVRWCGNALTIEARQRQSMVFQRPIALRRSVRANVAFPLSGRTGLTREDVTTRTDAVLDSAGLAAMAHRPARVLSGGEQQRLALARALVTEPDLLLLDEPTASLDPASTLAIETLIRAAHDRGVTIVLITHSPAQALRLTTRCVVIHDGQIAEVGESRHVLTQPSSVAGQAWLNGDLLASDTPLDRRAVLR